MLRQNYWKSLCAAGFLILLLSILIFPLFAPVGEGKRKLSFRVYKGESAQQVGRNLAREKLIAHSSAFRWYLHLSGQAEQIQAGSYYLHDAMWMDDIAAALTQGRVELRPLTIPEGWNHRQIGDYLQKEGLVESREVFLALSRDKAVLRKYNILDDSTEGYLYPDTYMIPESYSAKQLHELMLKNFFTVLDRLLPKRSSYSSEKLRERIILASIVEREARHAQERPIIAGVFLNRLHRKMKLESCATVQYLFPAPKAKLYLRDLTLPSPYNTYRNHGLPKAPISNPGKAALKAAFFPQQNSYLYFVVKADGRHHFSESYHEHLQAKKKYIDSDIVIAE